MARSIKVQGLQPRRTCAFDVVGQRISHHESGARLHSQTPTRLQIGLTLRLWVTHLDSREELNPRYVEPTCAQLALLHLARPVRQHPDLEA